MQNALLYDEEKIAEEIADIPLWTRAGSAIIRELVMPNFAMAIGVINAIAVLAEAADHHPDLLLYGWNKVRITLSTHSLGGLTPKDFLLAKKIDELGF